MTMTVTMVIMWWCKVAVPAAMVAVAAAVASVPIVAVEVTMAMTDGDNNDGTLINGNSTAS